MRYEPPAIESLDPVPAVLIGLDNKSTELSPTWKTAAAEPAAPAEKSPPEQH